MGFSENVRIPKAFPMNFMGIQKVLNTGLMHLFRTDDSRFTFHSTILFPMHAMIKMLVLMFMVMMVVVMEIVLP
jgi:hypothetical protein